MSESTKKRWMSMAGVSLAVFGSFAALMYLSVRTFGTQQARSKSAFFRFQLNDANTGKAVVDGWQRPSTSSIPNHNKTKYLLSVNRERKVGDIVLTYRGMEGRSKISIDSVIPALDPQYTYKRTIDIAKARKGFRIGGKRFVLLSAGKKSIRIISGTRDIHK